jgi:hypothetical protein
MENKIIGTINREGFTYTLQRALPYLYSSYVRQYLPRSDKKRELNGIFVRSGRIFDSCVPWRVTHRDPVHYEESIVDSINSYAKLGDQVAIVGGGWGVTTVYAARAVGDEGCVKVYEASNEYAEYTRETAKINGVRDRVDVTNAVVSHSVSTRGKTNSDKILQPTELPDCDVLQLDCEGAELEILSNIDIRPRVIIVETHGCFGSPTENVIQTLEDLSYDIISQQPAETGRNLEKCEQNDIIVVAGTHLQD